MPTLTDCQKLIHEWVLANEENLGIAQDARQLVKNLLEAWNAHEVERVVSLHAPDYEGTDVGEVSPRHGREGMRQAMERYLRAFPDLHIAEETTVVEANRVALVLWVSGTHGGPIMNIPPTGHCIAIRGVMLLTLDNGQIKRAVYLWDVAAFLREIGLLPEL